MDRYTDQRINYGAPPVGQQPNVYQQPQQQPAGGGYAPPTFVYPTAQPNPPSGWGQASGAVPGAVYVQAAPGYYPNYNYPQGYPTNYSANMQNPQAYPQQMPGQNPNYQNQPNYNPNQQNPNFNANQNTNLVPPTTTNPQPLSPQMLNQNNNKNNAPEPTKPKPQGVAVLPPVPAAQKPHTRKRNEDTPIVTANRHKAGGQHKPSTPQQAAGPATGPAAGPAPTNQQKFTMTAKIKALRKIGNLNNFKQGDRPEISTGDQIRQIIRGGQNQAPQQPQQPQQTAQQPQQPADDKHLEEYRRRQKDLEADKEKMRIEMQKIKESEQKRGEELRKMEQQYQKLQQDAKSESERIRLQLEEQKRINAQIAATPQVVHVPGNAAAGPHVWELKSSVVELRGDLGKGAFGEVRKGMLHGKDVAVKILFQQDTDEETLLSFKQEVGVMNNLRHPNILLLMGACFERDNMMIVTEFMPGGSIDTYVHGAPTRLSFPQRMKVARDCALGMTWLHNLNPPFLHLDLKLANLLVNWRIEPGVMHGSGGMGWTVKVADFGLTQMKTAESNGEEGMVGSPFYMAPEMLLERDYNEKVDVYSFGIMLWELFTLQEPYKDRFTDLDELIDAVTHAGERPQWPSGHIENVNASGGVEATEKKVKELVQWCWSGSDSDRPGFNVICDKLWDIVLEFTIWGDEVGRKFWKDSFYDKWEMTWEEFWKGFEKSFGVKPVGDNDRKMRCMKLVMSTVGGSGEKNNVNMSDWGLFLAYFGKIKTGSDVLDNCERIAQKPWFFGSLSMKEVESYLAGKKKGTFLVRFSASNAGSYTVSTTIDKKGKVKHTRFGRGEGGKYGFENNWYNTMEEFIAGYGKNNGLELPCPGSPFQKLFMAPTSATYSDNEYLAPGALQKLLK